MIIVFIRQNWGDVKAENFGYFVPVFGQNG